MVTAVRDQVTDFHEGMGLFHCFGFAQDTHASLELSHQKTVPFLLVSPGIDCFFSRGLQVQRALKGTEQTGRNDLLLVMARFCLVFGDRIMVPVKYPGRRQQEQE